MEQREEIRKKARQNLESALENVRSSGYPPEYEPFIPKPEEYSIEPIQALGVYMFYNPVDDTMTFDETTAAFSSIAGLANVLLHEIAFRTKMKLLPESRFIQDEEWKARFKRLGGKSALELKDADEPELFKGIPSSEYFPIVKSCSSCSHTSALPYYQAFSEKISKVFIMYKLIAENNCVRCRALYNKEVPYNVYLSKEVLDDEDFKSLLSSFGLNYKIF